MTARTHDLAAFTSLSFVAATQSLPTLSLATVLVSLGAGFLGGLAPDIDQPTNGLWHRGPAGSVIGRVVHPFLGGHRTISHSFLGMGIVGIIVWYFLQAISSVLLVNMWIVWCAFMIGVASHLIIDTFTKEGVPWLFPIPMHFGIPPIEALRIKTGGLYEKSLVFPGLLALNLYLYYSHYVRFIFLLHQISF